PIAFSFVFHAKFKARYMIRRGSFQVMQPKRADGFAAEKLIGSSRYRIGDGTAFDLKVSFFKRAIVIVGEFTSRCFQPTGFRRPGIILTAKCAPAIVRRDGTTICQKRECSDRD